MYVLRSAEVQIEVAKFQPHTLPTIPDKLIFANEIFRIGAGISGGQYVPRPFDFCVYRESAWRAWRRCAHLKFGCKQQITLNIIKPTIFTNVHLLVSSLFIIYIMNFSLNRRLFFFNLNLSK